MIESGQLASSNCPGEFSDNSTKIHKKSDLTLQKKFDIIIMSKGKGNHKIQ